MELCMSLISLAGVTVALFLAYLFAVTLVVICTATETEMKDPRPFLRRVYYLFVLVEIGMADAAAGVILGVL